MKRLQRPSLFFTPDEEKEIMAAIHWAEMQTSGEIRIHLATHCHAPILQEAAKVFESLGMTATAERNGVLIYIATKDHQFAVIGDKGIDQKVPPDFWDQAKKLLQNHFQKGDFTEGLKSAIHLLGMELAKYFPRKGNDRNELSNELSRG